MLKAFFDKKEKIEYASFSSNVVYTKGTNSKKTEEVLKNISPDIIVLAQTGIIRKQIIDTAKIGVLNIHPAVLPYYKGIDCYKWAIVNNEQSKIGSTVHWVNTGVDTGNIIKIKKYSIGKSENKQMIEKNLDILCISNLIETIKEFDAHGIQIGIEQDSKEGKQYYKMPVKLEREVRRKLKSI